MTDHRKIDALIAEHVLGMRWHHEKGEEAYFLAPVGRLARTHYKQVPKPDVGKYWGYIEDTYVKKYSTDLGAAADVIEKAFSCSLSKSQRGWTASWAAEPKDLRNPTGLVTGHQPTASLAICLAALKACGVELPAQSVGTTSDSTQSPADPDDSAPSVRGESEGPGSC